MKSTFLLFILTLFSGSSYANILWTWSFDTEAGTFVTDGDWIDTTSAGTFAFVEGTFDVSLSGGGVIQKADPTALVYYGVGTVAGSYTPGYMNWSGSAVTSFSVPSSSLSNVWWGNASSTSPSRPYIYQFTPNAGKLREWRGSSLGFTEIAAGPLTIIPVVPEPATLSLLAFGGLLLRKRK